LPKTRKARSTFILTSAFSRIRISTKILFVSGPATQFLHRGEYSMTRQAGKNISNSQSPAQLAPKLDKDLFSYALTATVAGVGMMALTPCGEAKVIATPANIPVPINGAAVQIDLNGDGIADITVSGTSFVDTFGGGVRRHGNARPPLGGIFGDHLFCSALRSNGVGVNGTNALGREMAAAMAGGARVGPALPFMAGRIAMAGLMGCGCGTTFSYGNWLGSHPPHPYLPVKFTDSEGKIHFGWVRIDVSRVPNATITGYAYETIPNKPITAGVTHGPVSEDAKLVDPMIDSDVPKAASLGMLALGAPSLAVWRRQETAIV
jgi:hypothetical protein